jgi:hypothetical protein
MRWIGFVMLMISSLMGVVGLVSAQEAAPGVYVYGCKFDEDSGQAQIRLALINRDGQPLNPSAWQVRSAGSDEALPADTITLEPVEQRAPARVILVVDTTFQYPSEALREVLENQMLLPPYLFPTDELGLVKFDVDAAVLGTPSTDKGQLFNLHGDKLTSLRQQEANTAVLYEGIFSALDSNSNVDPAQQRLVILVFTDSQHSTTQSPVTLDQVIRRAQELRAQVFPILFDNFGDQDPDPAAMQQLANATGGHVWSTSTAPEADRSLDAFKTQMTQFLTAADMAVNAEYVLSIPGELLEPDENQVAQVAITLTSGVDELPLPVQNCDVLLSQHAIILGTVSPDSKLVPVDGSLTVNYAIEPPPADDDNLEIRLFMNGRSLPGQQLSAGDQFQLSLTDVQSALQAGANTLQIELYREDERIAEAVEVRDVRFQRPLTLCVLQADECVPDATVSGATTFQVGIEGDAGDAANAVVRFRARVDGGEYQAFGTDELAAGSADFIVPNINTEVTNLFGEEEISDLEIVAFIGDSGLERADFVSAPLPVTLGTPEVTVTPAATTSNLPMLLLPFGIAGVLAIVDLLLLRQIGKARVKRLIRYPDALIMPDNPLKITAQRDGNSQTFVLTKRTMNVGRGTANEINLSDDTNVSREHGVVMFRRGRWYYANRKPKIRATVDKKNLRGYQMRELKDRTQMQLGDYVLVCHYGDVEDLSALAETQL